MKSIHRRIAAVIFSISAALLAVSHVQAQSQDGYTQLIDGVSLDGWNIIGNANWAIGKGIVESDKRWFFG